MPGHNPYVNKVINCPAIYTLEDGWAVDALRERLKGHSVIVELGCGSGGHLIAHALAHPGYIYVGFELRYKRIFRTYEKSGSPENLILVRHDARRFEPLLAGLDIKGFFINFPDPWKKKKWEKHRLISTNVFAKIAAVLKPGGFLAVKTDDQGNYQEALRGIAETPSFFLKHNCNDLYGLVNLPNEPLALVSTIKTEFEQLFINQGVPIKFIMAEHIDSKKCRSFDKKGVQ